MICIICCQINNCDLESDMNFIMEAFRVAARAFKEQNGSRVVMLIEDIHGLISAQVPNDLRRFLGQLLNMYNAGLVDVIFTVSDYNAVEMPKNSIDLCIALIHSPIYCLLVSGHSRLDSEFFPQIPDNTLVQELSVVGIKATQEQVQSVKTKSKSLQELLATTMALVWSRKDQDVVIPVFPELQSASYIVRHLGSHMADTTGCMQRIVIDGVDPQGNHLDLFIT
jgi:hypothetical protein